MLRSGEDRLPLFWCKSRSQDFDSSCQQTMEKQEAVCTSGFPLPQQQSLCSQL